MRMNNVTPEVYSTKHFEVLTFLVKGKEIVNGTSSRSYIMMIMIFICLYLIRIIIEIEKNSGNSYDNKDNIKSDSKK